MGLLEASENKLELFRKSKPEAEYFERILTHQAENPLKNPENFICEIMITSIKSEKENHMWVLLN